jgi:hypothetical protein|eukprot:COSAG06_NODE_1179_length_10388_cov_7.454563_7_plen_85_part_00
MGREPGSICDVRAHLVCLGVPVVLGCLMIRFMLISLVSCCGGGNAGDDRKAVRPYPILPCAVTTPKRRQTGAAVAMRRLLRVDA